MIYILNLCIVNLGIKFIYFKIFIFNLIYVASKACIRPFFNLKAVNPYEKKTFGKKIERIVL